MIIIGSDSEIMYFPPSFHFKKGLAKFTIEVRLIRGFRQKSGCVLYADATYTRVYTVIEKLNIIFFFTDLLSILFKISQN